MKIFKKILLVAGVSVFAWSFAVGAMASEITGDLTTGLSPEVGGVVVVAPTASPIAGTYTAAQSVSLTAKGAQSIHYTKDGATPTCITGLTYSSAISIAVNTTVKAISCYANSVASAVAIFEYTIQSGGEKTFSKPTASPIAGTYTGTQSVILTAEGAVSIHYTINSDTPTCGGGSVYTSGITVSSSLTLKAVACYSDGISDVAVFAYAIQSQGGGGGGGGGGSFSPQVQGQVLGQSTIASHPNGTLILDGQTIYLIENNQRRGFRNPEEYASYGYKFEQAVTANEADKLLPEGIILRAMTGTLALDKADNRTIYMVGQGYTKRGFAAFGVFSELGYNRTSSATDEKKSGSYAGMFEINLSDYPAGTPIVSGTEAHPEGALVLEGSTVWWILGGQKRGFESQAVFDTYGFTFDRVVSSNAADKALPEGSLVKFRDGTLVKDGSVYYIISEGKARPFESVTALTAWGYKTANVIFASVNAYEKGTVIK